MKKGLRSGVLLLCLLAAAAACLFYGQYSAQKIYEESAGHLQEVYNQIGTAILDTTENNWAVLHEWEAYIAWCAANDHAALADHVEKSKALRGFTEFYLVAENGYFRTMGGRSGYLNLGQGLKKLMLEGQDVVVDSSMATGERVIVFAVPVEPTAYGDFTYSAVAMAFGTDDMSSTLAIEAFSGEGMGYVIYPDGRVLVDYYVGETQNMNVIAYLEDGVLLMDKSISEIQSDWKNQQSDVIRYEREGKIYYLTYQPLGFSSWMLLGVVPAQTVNAVMNQYTVVTLGVMGFVFLLVAAAIVLLFYSFNRRRMDQKNIELQSREKLFDVLTVNTDDVFVLFCADTMQAEYVSSNVGRVLGLDGGEVRADVRLLLGLMAQEDGGLNRETLNTISEEQPWSGNSTVRHLGSGDLRWFRAMLYRLPGDGERFILTLSDRTQDRKMNQALEEALNAANAANDAKRNFLANMSHDIRTPMNAIVGFSSLLSQDAEKPDRVREYTRKITASSQHLLALINDILDMSKVESGKTSLNNMEFCLPELLDEIMEMLTPLARASSQDFQLRTRGILPEFLLGDKIRLNQILTNLLTNALKYTPNGGWIRLTVESIEQTVPNHAHLRFTVADNGCGISQEFLKHIFDPFARERTMHAGEIQGTGLGMPITNALVKLMGGTIHIESELGRGSVFTVELMLALADRAQDAGFWTKNGIQRVLIVDDEEDVLQDIRLLLGGVGVTADCAPSGYRALELAAEAQSQGKPYHAVLLDWKMPGLDGRETARLLRSKVGPKTPILMLTAFDADEIEESAKAAGVDKFLPKPFFLSYFQVALTELLGEQSRQEGSYEERSIAGVRVLAAEDHPFNAELLVQLLELCEVDCDMTSNGQEALDKFTASEQGTYDMIILDVQMPVMDGHEASRQIRASGHPDAERIPIIAMTANAFEDDVKAALAAGMNAHAAKPVGKDKLRSLIQQYCGR